MCKSCFQGWLLSLLNVPLRRLLRNTPHDQSCTPPRTMEKQKDLRLGCSLQVSKRMKRRKGKWHEDDQSMGSKCRLRHLPGCSHRSRGHLSKEAVVRLPSQGQWHLSQQQFPNLVSWLQLLPGSVVPLHSLFPFSNVIKNQKFAHRQTDVSTRSLIKALFVVAKLGKQPKHPPIED